VSSAGHPLPLILRADGTVDTVGRPGTLLGVAEDPDLCDEDSELSPGDCLLLYTDGLLDAHAPASAHRPSDVADVLASCKGLPAADVLARIETAMLRAGDGPPRDDVALLALRRV
jgi:serine phosphatase RsbU (regulator of sigma subunit)